MRGTRYPRLGDIVIRHYRDVRKKTKPSVHAGVVYKLHDGDVHICWQSKPLDYPDHVGYAAMNIHNMRSDFSVYREGVEIT